MDDRLLLPQRLIAQAFDVNPSTVARWPIEPAEKRGRESLYWLPAVIAWRMQDAEDEGLSLDGERARLARVQATLKEHELALLEKRLLTIEDAEAVVLSMIRAAKERLLGLGPELGAQVCGLAGGDDNNSPLVAERINKAVADALTELRDDVLHRA